MASKYLLWKYRDVKPDEPPPPMTRKEKIRNWIDYNKWWVVFWVVVAVILARILWSVLGIGEIKPDYMFAYVGDTGMPEDCAAALQASLESLGEDVNGDGHVAVELRQYVIREADDNPAAGLDYAAYASGITLTADLESGESYFFLLQDPESFQLQTEVLVQQDGSFPEEEGTGAAGMTCRWTDCPVLADLDLGEYSEDAAGQTVSGSSREFVSELYLARRGFYSERQQAKHSGSAEFWDRLTEGAVFS